MCFLRHCKDLLELQLTRAVRRRVRETPGQRYSGSASASNSQALYGYEVLTFLVGEIQGKKGMLGRFSDLTAFPCGFVMPTIFTDFRPLHHTPRLEMPYGGVLFIVVISAVD